MLLAGASLSLSSVCAQLVQPDQPQASCLVQLISYNETFWSGAINETVRMQPPSPTGSPPGGGGGGGSPSGLTNGERIAVIVVSIVGGLILIAVLVGVMYVYFRRKQKKWAPAKDEFDGIRTAQDPQADPAVSVITEEDGIPGTPTTALRPAAVPETPSTALRSAAGLEDDDDLVSTRSPPGSSIHVQDAPNAPSGPAN